MTDVTFEPPHHQPARGSDVEAFIKDERDKYDDDPGHDAGKDAAYTALDNLLDRYRLHADTGSWLWEVTSEVPLPD